jgi:hypothetical protein
MKFSLASLLIIPCFLSITSCGGNMMMSATSRQLQALTVTPAAASAQSTSRQVQFTVMGSFNMAPMSAVPQVLWSIGNPFSTMPMPAGGHHQPERTGILFHVFRHGHRSGHRAHGSIHALDADGNDDIQRGWHDTTYVSLIPNLRTKVLLESLR